MAPSATHGVRAGDVVRDIPGEVWIGGLVTGFVVVACVVGLAALVIRALISIAEEDSR